MAKKAGTKEVGSETRIRPDWEGLRESVLASAGLGFYELDASGCILAMDAGAVRLFELESRLSGASPVGRPIGSLLKQVFPPARMLDRLRRRGEIRDVEQEFFTASGARRWGRFCACHNAERDTFSVAARDVTLEKQSAEALRKSEQKFEQAFQASPDGAAIVRLDDGLLYEVSTKFTEILGYSSDAMVGRTTPQLCLWRNEEEQKAFLEELRARGECRNFETTLVARDGRLVAVELSGRVIEIDHETCVLVLVKDVTETRMAENHLRASEKLYRGLVENATEIIAEADESGRFLYANPAAIRLMGYTQDEVRGMHYLDVVRPDWRGRVTAILEGQARNGTPNVYHEFPALRRDGTVIWLGQNVRLIAEDGHRARFQAVCRDITERKLMEEALEQAKSEWERTFDAVPDLIMLIDRDFRIRRLNKAFADRLGKAPEEYLGRRCYELMHDHGFPPDFCPHQALISDGKLHTVEFSEPRLGGHFVVTTAPLTDERGELIGCVHVARDITQRKRAERDLRREHEFLSAILASVDTLVVVLDPDLRIVLFNRAAERLSGYTCEEVKGERPGDRLIAAEDVERVRADFSRVREGLFPAEYESKWRAKDGRVRLIAWTTTVIRDEAGNIRYAISAGKDISERKAAEEERSRMEQQLQHAQKLESLGVLAGGIAHDFNNILMGILGHAEITLMDLEPQSPFRDGILEIQTSAKRAAELTRQMLAYSGRGRFVIEPVDVSQLIREMTHLLRVSVSRKVDLRYELGRDLPLVDGDAAQIRQVILNLVTNASDAIGEKTGAITVCTRAREFALEELGGMYLAEALPAGDHVVLEVADTGCGIDKATMEKVFDPFFTTKFSGRGLGLAAVMGIVRGHKGAMKVTSAPGAGATFTILLPVSERKESEPVPQPQAVAPRRKTAGAVLVIDDEDAVRNVAVAMLERNGFKVMTAPDGLKGIALFKKSPKKIALILLDMTMPRIGGVETFNKLREIRADVPVILCSGYSEQDAAEKFAGHGLAGFLQKPYQADSLMKAIDAVTRKKSK